MEILRGIIGFFVAAYAILFAVSNRHDIDLYLSPLHEPRDIPLFAVGLVMLASGFVLGALSVWLNDSKKRQQKRAQGKEIKTLEKALEEAKQTKKAQKPPSDFFPALPKSSKR